ncbi:hypothetical protein L9F63_008855, partial [Diploptera punctata]
AVLKKMIVSSKNKVLDMLSSVVDVLPGYEIRVYCCLLQDLQSEIESHRDVFSSLNGTGRKLLSSLASQDDAVMLQRRLDEMNQRWHHLKAKSMAIRNRLESNSEHWNALLLSLRELIEWVIRKDTELTGLGPIGGDVACLQKQQVGSYGLTLMTITPKIKEKESVVPRLWCGGNVIASGAVGPGFNLYWDRLTGQYFLQYKQNM